MDSETQMPETIDTTTTSLLVEDFGPIVNANVELRPLTVFVGPSNTGKSVLSILLYSLHQTFGNGGPRGFRFVSRSRRRPDLTREAQRMVEEWAIEWLRSETDSNEPIKLPDQVANLARDQAVSGPYVPRVSSCLERCFGEDTSMLVRRPSRGVAHFSLTKDSAHTPKADVFNFRLDRAGDISGGPTFADRTVQTSPPQLRHLILDSMLYGPEGDEGRFSVRHFLDDLGWSLARSVVGPLAQPAYYLPADRMGIMHAHRVVVSSLIRRATRGGFEREAPLPELTGVLSDFLERLVNMPGRRPRPGNRRQQVQRLASDVEREVLGGTVGVAVSESGYPTFNYRPNGWQDDLPLTNASSMVSEVVPIVLFFRHVVGPGDTLIVEEPESHLHPAMQVELTRHLAAAVKRGVRVVLTTHSEWVLETLANLVRLSSVPSSKRDGMADSALALAPDQMGAWMFTPKLRPKGSVVEEIPLDVASGTFQSGYDEITEALYNNWVSISNRIEEGKL